ncbi:hypothetical protein T4B_11199 [Trichinella pseudospiralis]|uniref:Uncharacterized protein n=1 Tax=Trichinella pseudospiralis TaxID=6337 RepID=A0A0V1GMG3_TRIPS|nr:hypothetical protein T4B_11199 [Trichinella pseudospiralis]
MINTDYSDPEDIAESEAYPSISNTELRLAFRMAIFGRYLLYETLREMLYSLCTLTGDFFHRMRKTAFADLQRLVQSSSPRTKYQPSVCEKLDSSFESTVYRVGTVDSKTENLNLRAAILNAIVQSYVIPSLST